MIIHYANERVAYSSSSAKLNKATFFFLMSIRSWLANPEALASEWQVHTLQQAFLQTCRPISAFPCAY